MKKKIISVHINISAEEMISFLMVMVICLTMPGCFDMAPGGGKVKAADIYYAKSLHNK